MSDLTAKYQQYLCPEEFQQRLTEVGGINRYDEPNFIVIWSQGGGDNSYFRAGGEWNVEGLPSFRGYRNLLVGGGTPSWALMQWQDPIAYGTPEMYYIQNYDADSGLQTLGEYPYSGRYRLLYNLRYTEMRNGSLHFEAMPLNSYLLDLVVPVIMECKDISWEQTKAAMLDIKARQDAADVNMIEDVMRNSALPWKGNPVSYTRQGCRTTLVDKKIESMQRHWNKMMTRVSQLGTSRGLSMAHNDAIK